MANTTTSPNMNLPVPVVGTDPGPDWANNLVADMGIIDSHNHSTGQGVQITPSGLNINADLPSNGNNLTTARSVRFSAQGAPLAAASDIGCLYESGIDLYYNDGAGNQVRITQSGSVTGAAGTITGLPSGTASASFAAGVFSFKSATSVPSTMNFGIVQQGHSGTAHTISFGIPATLAANWAFTWPDAAPAANQLMVSDGSGNLSWTYGLLPIGSVIATFPNLTGAYNCVNLTSADDHGLVVCSGQTISDVTSPMNGQVIPNINSSAFLRGASSSGSTGGASSVTLDTSTLPAHTHTFSSTTGSIPSQTHAHNFQHTHEWGYYNGSNSLYSLQSHDNTVIGFNDVPPAQLIAFNPAHTVPGTGGILSVWEPTSSTGGLFTSAPLDAPSGTGSSVKTASPDSLTTVSGTISSTGSGSSFAILPPYINARYAMRIK